MKSKGLVALGLLGALTVGGVGGVKAYAQVSPNTPIKIEKSIAQTSKEDLSKGAFQKYFNVELDNNMKTEKIENVDGRDYTQISWEKGNTAYYALVENDGTIFDMGIVDITPGSYKNVTLIDLEDAKKIATNFIKENKLTEDVSKLEYLGEATIGPRISGIIYKLPNGKAITISVDSTTKKATAITYQTVENAKKSIEYSQYRQNGQLG